MHICILTGICVKERGLDFKDQSNDNGHIIGPDLVYLPQIQNDSSFSRYILTEDEKKEYQARRTDRKKTEYLGGRFAAKEAIFKATQDIHYLSYSILNDEKGRPYVKDHPEIMISLSHDRDYAIAFAVIL